MLKKYLSALFLLPLMVLAEGFTINPSNAVIRVTDKKLVDEAKELQLNLFKLTGKKIPIAKKGSAAKGKFVFEAGKIPAGVPANFKPEEGVWKKVGNALYFYGHERNGVSNAISIFLENELGIRWPAEGVILATPAKEIKVKNDSGSWAPKIAMRVLRRFSKISKESALWKKRMRMGSHAGIPGTHAFTNYWKRFGKTNPEFFALNSDGERAPLKTAYKKTDNQIASFGAKDKKIKMCVSSTGLHEQIIKDWQKKGGKFICISENDYSPYEYCGCEKCRALDTIPAKLGNQGNDILTDRYVYFANAVNKLALAKDPNVKITFYAYKPYLVAPTREKIAENFVIGIVPVDFITPKQITDLIYSWKKVGMKEFYWRPNQHHCYNTGSFFCGFEKHFWELQKIAIDAGSIGFKYDNPEAGPLALAFADYVLMRGMTNPEESYEDILNHYCAGFGPAAEDIKQFYEYWRKNWENRIIPQLPKVLEVGRYKNFARGLMWGEAVNCFKDADFDNTDKMLDTALSKNLPPETRKFVTRLKIANTEARLILQILRNKTPENSRKLYDFRKANKLPMIPYGEKKWGDPCGVKNIGLLGEYDAPYRKMPVLWSFKLDPADAGLKEKWYAAKSFRKWDGKIKIGMNWENTTPGKYASKELCKTLSSYDGIAWYATSFQLPADWKEREVYLLFEAVDESCQIFVNGKKAGEHLLLKKDDWQTPFAIRIDQCIKVWNGGHWNSVHVRVEDKSGNGGIWKNVHLVSRKKK
ncbi:MAG: DUF4838 domain-containing protein [Lentisphaerae bacterium]|nr:DUF4838 domain-containing protein [Lentisphaerota bacterium]MBE6390552.1 DUF4838 domain-containing protein [Lentisphaerota bacterium]